jgi:hypothetical protein
MELLDECFESDVKQKIQNRLFENFNSIQCDKIIEWLNSRLSRVQNSFIQIVIRKDNLQSLVVFSITTRFNGISREDSRYVTYVDTLGNVSTFEDEKSDYTLSGKEWEIQWLKNSLSTQLFINSQTIISVEKNMDKWEFVNLPEKLF